MTDILSKHVGYIGLNGTKGWTTGHCTTLKYYNEDKAKTVITQNIDDLDNILSYNNRHGIMCFRIGSKFIPFASHEINCIDWVKEFKKELRQIGRKAKLYNIRLSTHPDQFVLINSKSKDILQKSINELTYHAKLFKAMGLGPETKMQIHVGGVYGDKERSINRFVRRYKKLDSDIRDHLVVENDDRSYTVADCMKIYEETGVPVLFDNLHHDILNNGETMRSAMRQAFSTWGDIKPMVDYSTQQPGARIGRHTDTIDLEHFTQYIKRTRKYEFDIMLEIKDKEKSALKAVKVL